REENTDQLLMLRKAISAGLTEPTAVIGSEVLSFSNVTLDEFIGYIEETKRNLPENVAVTTAELYEVLVQNPRLIEVQRGIVGVHYYPFAHAIPIEHALDDLVDHYNQLKMLSGDKRVVIYETGWPSEGTPIGKAVPSVENQKKYIRDVTNWAQA